MENKGDSWEMYLDQLVCDVRVGMDVPLTNLGNASTEMTIIFDHDNSHL